MTKVYDVQAEIRELKGEVMALRSAVNVLMTEKRGPMWMQGLEFTAGVPFVALNPAPDAAVSSPPESFYKVRADAAAMMPSILKPNKTTDATKL